jgi:hypothetical protein
VSSRKQKNVDAAVAKLKTEGLSVTGLVCHVGLKEDREKLIKDVLQKKFKVNMFRSFIYFLFYLNRLFLCLEGWIF